MNGPEPTSLETIRRSRPARFAAVALLLFQVALSADHLGAVAARATGMVAADAALGLMALCHGGESSPLAPSQQGNPAERGDGCVLCSLAALAGHGLAPSAPVAEMPADVVAAVVTLPAVDAILDRRPGLRHGTLRGPPAVGLV